jgi:hypothetical protein
MSTVSTADRATPLSTLNGTNLFTVPVYSFNNYHQNHDKKYRIQLTKVWQALPE